MRPFGFSHHLRIGWLFTVALLPGLLASLLLLYSIYQIQRSELEQEAIQTARALSHAVDSELSGTKGKLQVLATSPYLQDNDLHLFYRQAKEVLATDNLASVVAMSDASGQQILNTLRPFNASLPKTGHMDMLRRTFASGQPSVSDVYIGGVAKSPFVAVEVPVRQAGKIVYALDMGIPPDNLSQLLTRQHLPVDWIATILDSQGTVVSRSLNQTQFVGKKGTPDFLQRMKQSSEGVFASHTLEGTPSFVAFSRSSLSGWTVAVAMPRGVLYRTLYPSLALTTLSVLAFIGGGLTLIWLTSRHIRSALKALETATEEFAAGDLGVIAPESGPREIAQLAAQFNRMLEARKKAEDEIARLAYYDPLTNLPNRRLLSERIVQSFAHADRHRTLMAVCYLDLDGFKPINDTYGHGAGDLALLEITRRLQNLTRTNDTVARIGGDEFVLLLDDLKSRDECDAILARVLQRVSEPITLKQDIVVQVSASIGTTLYPGDMRDADILLRHSDQAMYQAKQAGRNRVHFFDISQNHVSN